MDDDSPIWELSQRDGIWLAQHEFRRWELRNKGWRVTQVPIEGQLDWICILCGVSSSSVGGEGQNAAEIDTTIY